MTNPIDIACIVARQKLFTIDGLDVSNVFYFRPTTDLDFYCNYYDISTNLIKNNNYYKELLTVITFHISVWRKITSNTDTTYMGDIVEDIDAVLTGENIEFTEPILNTDGTPKLDDNNQPLVNTYRIKTGEKIDLLSDMHLEADDVWLQRGAIYKFTMAGSAN